MEPTHGDVDLPEQEESPVPVDRLAAVNARALDYYDEHRQTARSWPQTAISPARWPTHRDYWLLAQHGVTPQLVTVPDGSNPAGILERRGIDDLVATLRHNRRDGARHHPRKRLGPGRRGRPRAR